MKYHVHVGLYLVTLLACRTRNHSHGDDDYDYDYRDHNENINHRTVIYCASPIWRRFISGGTGFECLLANRIQ